MTKYTKPNRDFEQELLEIKKNHDFKLNLIKTNTLSLFEACRDLIIFNIRRSLIVGSKPYVRDIVINSLDEIIPNISSDINFEYRCERGLDGMSSIVTLFSSTYFDNNDLDCGTFIELVLNHIRGVFIIDHSQRIKEK